MKRFYKESMENWFRCANFSIMMYLAYGDDVYYDGIKKDCTIVFNRARKLLDCK